MTNCISLGGVHTTVSVPARLSHFRVPDAEKAAAGITKSLVRLSAGLENVDDLKRDLDRALKKAVRISSCLDVAQDLYCR